MKAPIRLLFIEDDEIDQQAFIRTVKRNQLTYQYVIESNLASAYERLETQLFDVVICDYLLSDGTALDLIQAHSPTPVIVITGSGDETVAVNVMKAGARDYVIKDNSGDYLNLLTKSVDNVVRHQALEKAEREQRTIADTLRDTAVLLNSTLELDEILKLILENIKRIIPHDAANVMLIDHGIARVVQHTGWPSEKIAMLAGAEFKVSEMPFLNLMYQTRDSCIINDVAAVDAWVQISPGYEPASYLSAPICVNDEVLGFLNLDSNTRNQFTPEHAHRVKAFVEHAGVALKNARLYKYSRDLATLEERQRLARDLHDSVSQTLFAASVISNAIIKQWHQDSTSIGSDLLELRDLTQGALAEMRTLLLELRPNALAEANLSDLIQQLSQTVKGRARLNVTLDTDMLCPIQPHVQIALFRIAQESLNNVIKHARAKNLYIQLKCSTNDIELVIRDDGRGFDAARGLPRQFGIEIMKERALEAGITLQIMTSLGQGTTVRAVWVHKDEHE
jgi:signal transduction histidine kinase